jgi:hypothetical protein
VEQRTEQLDAEHRIGNANNDWRGGDRQEELNIETNRSKGLRSQIGPGWMFGLFSEKRFLSL